MDLFITALYCSHEIILNLSHITLAWESCTCRVSGRKPACPSLVAIAVHGRWWVCWVLLCSHKSCPAWTQWSGRGAHYRSTF